MWLRVMVLGLGGGFEFFSVGRWDVGVRRERCILRCCMCMACSGLLGVKCISNYIYNGLCPSCDTGKDAGAPGWGGVTAGSCVDEMNLVQ